MAIFDKDTHVQFATHLSEQLQQDLRQYRLNMIEDDPSVRYESNSNTLVRKVEAQRILDDDYHHYQLQKTPEWMGISVIEMARKAIMHSQLRPQDKVMALKDITGYFKRYRHVCESTEDNAFLDGIAMADHAREYIYDVLLEFGLIGSRKEFNQLRNAGVMWRLFDRMGVKTHIDFGHQQQAIDIQSQSWEFAHPDQDKLLAETASMNDKSMSAADKIIKNVQKEFIDTDNPLRLAVGSQERDWYAPNAQVTRFKKEGVPTLTYWTNGDLRSKTKYYSQSLVKKVLSLNIKQLILNATGIGMGQKDQAQYQNFCESKDVFGRQIQLTPICILNDCQSYISKKRYGSSASKMMRRIPVFGEMMDEEHQNLLQRDAAIKEVNTSLYQSIGLKDFLIPLNTPLAVHGRKYFTYVSEQIPEMSTVMHRLIDNYASILCLDQHAMAQEVGIDINQLKRQITSYLQHPSHDRLSPLAASLTAIHQHAMQFYGQDFADSGQVAKVVRSIACLNDTLKHYQTYANSKQNFPHEVLNFTSGLLTSVALLNDATMINIKCKSGKDRTGVMKQCVQANYDYWTNAIRSNDNQGLPEMTDHFDCDQKASLQKFKVLLGSGAWTTAVAQDCQCPALKSLGSPISSVEKNNTLKEKTLNLIGDGALSEKQRAFIGKDMLHYQKQRSAMNGDFHKLVATKQPFKQAHDRVKCKFEHELQYHYQKKNHRK